MIFYVCYSNKYSVEHIGSLYPDIDGYLTQSIISYLLRHWSYLSANTQPSAIFRIVCCSYINEECDFPIDLATFM